MKKLEYFTIRIDYFEETWFPKNEDSLTKYDFKLWSYADKFVFAGTKKELIKSGQLDKYILFSNNDVESFNHIMNQCLDSNSKVSISKFEETLKHIFTETNDSKNDKKLYFLIFLEK